MKKKIEKLPEPSLEPTFPAEVVKEMEAFALRLVMEQQADPVSAWTAAREFYTLRKEALG